MQQPPIDILMNKLDSKYALVVATAKRARMLTDGSKPLVENAALSESFKPVSLALEEIAAGKIHVEQPKGGIK